jgi:hypothetical protein
MTVKPKCVNDVNYYRNYVKISQLVRFNFVNTIIYLHINITQMRNLVAYLKLNKHTAFGDIMDSIAMILIAIWAVGFFLYNSDQTIHFLLLTAFVAELLRLYQSRKSI